MKRTGIDKFHAYETERAITYLLSQDSNHRHDRFNTIVKRTQVFLTFTRDIHSGQYFLNISDLDNALWRMRNKRDDFSSILYSHSQGVKNYPTVRDIIKDLKKELFEQAHISLEESHRVIPSRVVTYKVDTPFYDVDKAKDYLHRSMSLYDDDDLFSFLPSDCRIISDPGSPVTFLLTKRYFDVGEDFISALSRHNFIIVKDSLCQCFDLNDLDVDDKNVDSSYIGKDYYDRVLDLARKHFPERKYQGFKRSLDTLYIRKKFKEDRVIEHRHERREKRQQLRQLVKEAQFSKDLIYDW